MELKCVAPPEITEYQISLLLDGFEDENVLNHLKQCEYCMNRVKKARSFESSLHQQLYRFDCPSSDDLTDYYMELTNEHNAKSIADHLAQCPSCQKEMRMLEKFVADDLPNDQEAESLRDEHILRPHPGYFTAAIEDYATARKARGKDAKQFRATVDEIQILFDTQLTKQGIVLNGTIMSQKDVYDWTSSLVHFQQGGRAKYTCAVDEFSMFHCDAMDVGEYSVRIVAQDGKIIELSSLNITMDT